MVVFRNEDQRPVLVGRRNASWRGAGRDQYLPALIHKNPITMNTPAQLLTRTAFPLHDPALEVQRRMDEKRVRVRMTIPKKSTEKDRSTYVEFTLIDGPVNVENPAEVLAKAVKATVDYFNVTRKIKVVANGNKIKLVQEKVTKAAKPEEGTDTQGGE